MPKTQTYGERMRQVMRTKNIKLRDIEKATHFSYEHLRKVRMGRPILSKELNEAICAFLGLDPAEMWELATAEKLRHRYGQVPAAVTPPADDRLRKYWSHLNAGEQAEVAQLVEAMARKRMLLSEDNEGELIDIIAKASERLGRLRVEPPARRARAK